MYMCVNVYNIYMCVWVRKHILVSILTIYVQLLTLIEPPLSLKSPLSLRSLINPPHK